MTDLLTYMDRRIHPCRVCGHRIYGNSACGICAVLDARVAGAA